MSLAKYVAANYRERTAAEPSDVDAGKLGQIHIQHSRPALPCDFRALRRCWDQDRIAAFQRLRVSCRMQVDAAIDDCQDVEAIIARDSLWRSELSATKDKL